MIKQTLSLSMWGVYFIVMGFSFPANLFANQLIVMATGAL